MLIEVVAKHRESVWCEMANTPVMIPCDAWHGRVLAILLTLQ
jgi:hypothetical protein